MDQRLPSAQPSKGECEFDCVTDVIVVGFGNAGAISAISASDAGADVILLEKMRFPGGISICAGGGIRYSVDANETFRYLRATNDGRTPDEVLQTFAENMVGLDLYLKDLAHNSGAVVVTQDRPGNYPFEGYEHIPTVHIENVPNFNPEKEYPHVRGRQGVNLFKILHDHIRSREIDLRLGHSARRLLRNAEGQIVGLSVQRPDGRTIRVGAKRAVILACGGFEASPEMQAQFWEGGPRLNSATRANTGDGIRMAQELGADLWHMWHCHGSYGFRHPDLPYAIRVKKLPDWVPGKTDTQVRMSWILLDRRGKRFMNEYEPYLQDTSQRRFSRLDTATQSFPNIPAWLIVDEAGRKLYPLAHAVYNDDSVPVFQWSNDNLAEVDLGILRRYNSVSEMAEGLHIPQTVLEDNLGRWNASVHAGEDTEFGRPAGSLFEIKTPPFYVGEIWPFVTNTQGGPVHDSRQRILNTFSEPIPRLYEAGELGSIWGHLYLSGANLTECIITGRIAGANAAAEIPHDLSSATEPTWA
jgi:succinate dehydrogenase/fumarate reductase flavoprotein subunit